MQFRSCLKTSTMGLKILLVHANNYYASTSLTSIWVSLPREVVVQECAVSGMHKAMGKDTPNER